MLRAICASGIGMRSTHEDNFLLNGKIMDKKIQKKMSELKIIQYQSVCRKKVNFIAVSDGMGGHNAGEVASNYCMKKIADLEEKAQNCTSLNEVISLIQKEIVHINNSICEYSEEYPELSGMGATLIMLVNYESENAILNIGDSRAYSIGEAGICQISKDHTEGQRMIDLGILTRKEVESFPAKKNLNRYIGYFGRGYQLQADVFYLFPSESLILLCSDGVCDIFDEKKMLDYFCQDEELYDIAKRIVNDACYSKNADNATLIIIKIKR